LDGRVRPRPRAEAPARARTAPPAAADDRPGHQVPRRPAPPARGRHRHGHEALHPDRLRAAPGDLVQGRGLVIGMIYAVSPEGVIGVGNAIPWKYPGDLRRFKRLTLGSTVVMGRATFESMGKKPLKGRR